MSADEPEVVVVPAGDALLDLNGNVREWTNTWADAARVLRGGSYLDALAESLPSRRLGAEASPERVSRTLAVLAEQGPPPLSRRLSGTGM